MTIQETIIPVSRLKVYLLTLGSLGFVVVGIIMIVKAFAEFQATAVLIILIGIVAVMFFGACLLFGLYRLFSRKPGLILRKEGFEDYSSFLGGHFIT
jgi:hypothetical protein